MSRLVPDAAADPVTMVVQASLVLASAGLSDMIWGHVSVRDPEGRGVWMKAAGWGMAEITPDRVILVSPDGEILYGDGPRHVEYPIHTEIMAARPDVASVVHSHSTTANQFAALDEPMLPLDNASSLFTYPDIPRFTQTGGMIKDHALGADLAERLGEANACLMPQHGVAVVGEDAPTAVMTAIMLDQACRTQLGALAAGPVKRWGTKADTIAKRTDGWSAKQITAAWHYWLRQQDINP